MIFIKLILAHLLGDFIFQPTVWVRDKEAKKTRSLYLYLHTLLHAVLVFVLIGEAEDWWIAVVIGISHFLIDAAKLHLQTRRTQRKWFFVDQLLHLAVIVAISLWFAPVESLNFFWNPQLLKIITAIVFLTLPASIIVKNLISLWTPVVVEHSEVKTESLVHAGKFIGILERLLVFVFIAVNHWEGVGFMIAAKSVFRFSDLAQAKQRKLTEYVLIGTLLSFGIAILTGLALQL